MFIIQCTYLLTSFIFISVINFILIIVLCFFCRATNALISVRLDYNNLRKKYRNF